MAETSEVPAAAPVAKKSKTAAKPKKPKTASSHPKVSDMVNSAIGSLKERGGSSLQAIKKHIAANHKVDVEKLSPFIKKYLKSAVASGNLVQTKGKGATGSFRMSATTGKVKPAKKPAPAKAAAKKPKAAAAQKPKQVKKAAKPKASKITKKAKVVKPKTPKPKKAKTPVKKAASKKGAKK